MKISKSISAILLVGVMMCSFVFPASARSQVSYNVGSSYSRYTTCKLINKKKPGYVRVNVWNTSMASRNSVKLTTKTGKYIWSENGAIPFNGGRTFYLGNDNSSYRMYVKTNKGKGAVTFANCGNVDLS